MSEIPQGAIRFNTDSQKLEFYAQGEWWVMSTDTPNLGRSVDSTPGARGVFAGGYGTSPNAETDEIRYINISSTGDTIDFGDLSGNKSGAGAGQAASPTRGLFMGGNDKIGIDFITFASTGNATTFGASTMSPATYSSALSNSTRGIQAGGVLGGSGNNTIEYVTISSTGNAVDFGNLSTLAVRSGGAASPTRGLILGGRTAVSSGQHNSIQFITIATLGNAQDFGDLNDATRDTTGTCSNPIRALVFGGVNPSSISTIDYVTIATMGNSVKFGDLGTTCNSGTSVNSPTRGVHAISNTPSGDVNTLEYVNIATTGNAVDFGDNNNNRMRHAWPTSNGHGGL